MNPVPAAVLLAFAIGSGFAPWRKAGWTTPVRALLCEAAAVVAAVALAWLSRGLVYATSSGYFWGRLLLLAGGVLVRLRRRGGAGSPRARPRPGE